MTDNHQPYDRYCNTCSTLCDWVVINCDDKRQYCNAICPTCLQSPVVYKLVNELNAIVYDAESLYRLLMKRNSSGGQ